jgi:transcription initiation factor TFIID TATA-box-binding protein
VNVTRSIRVATSNLCSISILSTAIMEQAGIFTHPNNAKEAQAFAGAGSLSYPGAAGHLTPPSPDAKDAQSQQANRNGVNGQQQGVVQQAVTPAATPGQQQTQGVSI